MTRIPEVEELLDNYEQRVSSELRSLRSDLVQLLQPQQDTSSGPPLRQQPVKSQSTDLEGPTVSNSATDISPLPRDHIIEHLTEAESAYRAGSSRPPFLLVGRASTELLRLVIVPTVQGERPDVPTMTEIFKMAWKESGCFWCLDINRSRKIVKARPGAPGRGEGYYAWEGLAEDGSDIWSDMLVISTFPPWMERDGQEERPIIPGSIGSSFPGPVMSANTGGSANSVSHISARPVRTYRPDISGSMTFPFRIRTPESRTNLSAVIQPDQKRREEIAVMLPPARKETNRYEKSEQEKYVAKWSYNSNLHQWSCEFELMADLRLALPHLRL